MVSEVFLNLKPQFLAIFLLKPAQSCDFLGLLLEGVVQSLNLLFVLVLEFVPLCIHLLMEIDNLLLNLIPEHFVRAWCDPEIFFDWLQKVLVSEIFTQQVPDDPRSVKLSCLDSIRVELDGVLEVFLMMPLVDS